MKFQVDKGRKIYDLNPIAGGSYQIPENLPSL